MLLPGVKSFDERYRSEIPRFQDIRPAAIALCETPAQVRNALRYARERGLPIAVRGGGHDFAGRSSTTGVLLDTGPASGVELRGDRVVIGAGTRLGAVYDALAAHGRTIPAGCGPTVGVAGLTLGGGLGILGRTYGLTCDSLRAATVVLADGRVVGCDATREPDLFWCLRGGGAPGVVLGLEFVTVPAPASTAFRLRFPPPAAAEVLDAWQRLAPDAPDALAASLVISACGDVTHPLVVTVFGAIHDLEAEPAGDGRPRAGGGTVGGGGDEGSAARGALDHFISALGVDAVSEQRWPGTYRATKTRLAATDPHDEPWPEDGHTWLHSEYFRDAVPAAELVAGLIADRRPGEWRELDFSPWAGAYNRVPADATAFPHRDARFLLKQSATVAPGDRPSGWLDGSAALTSKYGTGGAYPNFPEPGRPDTAFWGLNTARRQAVRTAYDPDGVFDREVKSQKPSR
jgi:hypothetical protein